MTTSRDRRVAKELADIQADKDSSGVFAAPADGVSLRSLVGMFPAPPDTPYAGGTYEVEVDIPDTYPFKPPKMRFKTKIWHPNVSSQTGAICLDTLTTGWSPVQTIKTALLSLRMLLEFPNSKDPQDAEVAKMMNEHPEQFAIVAHEWAVKYASAPRRQIDTSQFAQAAATAPKDDAARYNGYNKNMVDKFTSMGFDVEAVVEAFRFVGIDRNNGCYYELEEAYMGDITAKLLGEQ
ncbi:ubiquitin-conjugating enzyme E2-24 kDa [Cordyceps javanica]|uniref:Ubiquitin-conjugating enzyme E2 2 n=1 Tax=Cordyceps javanica TaxID=43265 RepID=A0A545VZV1_9HYPO|nr:ubiquitin-conjugating enzyme E2-24 kDa [Cordyceps javanica]TQW07251.1 ubiquitin-conjugating enzyme E2-24 kDa [Cordyceps javanica]